MIRPDAVSLDGLGEGRVALQADLQVHHKNPRSLLGDDSEPNLITLGAKCHLGVRRLARQRLEVRRLHFRRAPCEFRPPATGEDSIRVRV